MSKIGNLISILLHLLLLLAAAAAVQSSPLLGISPQDHKYYFDGAVIACTDGSKTFPRNLLSDDLCDCPDGTDESGTAACPESKFYCRNAGDVSHFLFSSRVNDRICDCCDGSDEYDGGVICPNTCLGNGDNLNTKIDELDPTIITSNQVNAEQRTSRLDVEDFIQILKGFRVAIVAELVAAIFVVTFYLFYRCNRARR